MKHDIRIAGHFFALRPVTMEDAKFMLELRTDPELAAYLNPTSHLLADQQTYLESYFSRPDDYYFIVHARDSGAAEGMLAIYDIDHDSKHAEWGRWILKRNSLAAVESACLVYRAGFEEVGLEGMYCRTVAKNGRVVSFHASCGLERVRELPGYVTLNGVRHDSVEQLMTREQWSHCGHLLDEKAERLARLLRR